MTKKSALRKIPLMGFFQEVKTELKKISWPTRDQITRLSLLVIVVSVATAAYLGALDFIFLNLVTFLITK